MRKIILSTIMAVVTVLGLGGVAMLAPSEAVWADGVNSANQLINESNDGNTTDLMKTLKIVINVILGAIGVIAVAMMIIGGVNYSVSQGDATKVKKAKDTILYGVIGLVIALLAFAIVNFVLSNVFGK